MPASLSPFRFFLALFLGAVGFAASMGAIYATPIAGVTDLGCPRGMDCATVLGSAFGKIGGIPLGVAGGFYFSVWMLFLIGHRLSGAESHRWIATLTLATGALVSTGLLAVLALVIRASCLYCLATHAANLGAAAVLWPLRRWRIGRSDLAASWRTLLALGATALLIGVGLWQLYEARVRHAEAESREKTIW